MVDKRAEPGMLLTEEHVQVHFFNDDQLAVDVTAL
jgi:hypothetical protein